MRTSPFWSAPAARAFLIACTACVLTACGGGGSSSSNGSNYVPNQSYCNPQQGIQLARPLNGQSGVSSSTGSIEIVADGSQNGNPASLYQTYQSWDIVVVPQFGGGQTTTGPLQLTSDTSGPHPYNQDFYFVGNLQGGLAPGQVYNVYLNTFTTNCNAVQIGQFST